MLRRPQRATRTDTLFPDTTLFRSELPPGEAGTIYFGGGPPYEYHNAPDKTESSKDPKGHGWTTLGDVGYLDEDDWPFLTDRRSEEHTSELQSLMRISYAVFCLKKKKHITS